MEEMNKIIRGNDFSLCIKASKVIEEEPIPVSFADFTDLQVRLTRVYNNEHIDMPFIVNNDGDIIVSVSNLKSTTYGIEVVGLYNGYNWRWARHELFRIVESEEYSNIIDSETADVDIYIVNVPIGQSALTRKDMEDYINEKMFIEDVIVDVDDAVGTPYGTGSFANGTLALYLHCLKGEPGKDGVDGKDGKDGAEGKQGIPGESAIFDPDTGNILATLENTIGTSGSNAMTQKAVTELFKESIPVSVSDALSGTVTISDGVGTVGTSTTQSIWIIPVKVGEIVHITTTNDSSKALRYGFSTTIPANSSTLSDCVSISSASISKDIISPITGYLCVNHHNDYFTDQAFYIIRDKTSENSVLNTYNFTVIDGKCIKSTTGAETTASSQSCTDYIDIEGLSYITYNRRFTSSTSSTNPGMAFYDSSKNYIIGQRFGIDDTARTEATTLAVPANAKYARFTLTTAMPTPDVKGYKESVYSRKTIAPTFNYGSLSQINGEIAFSVDGRVIATPRLIKTDTSFIVNSSNTVYGRIFYYDKDCAYLECSALTTFTANTDTPIPIHNQTEYVKVQFINGNTDSTVFTSIPNVTLTGHFPENWDVFNPRPIDSGYRRMAVRVRLTDPNCCDAELPAASGDTPTIEDAGEYGVDYGIICIPEKYSNIGKPTRLIIYCHGAAVNYDTDVTRFNSQDLEPDYWLAEGYAVMDIEGNPFDNENEHMSIPQAMDCYIAGYKWAIEHFNIRRDGVFLGGRSMGGGMTLSLMRKECPIPVIAACPNAPATFMPFGTTAVRKTFWATHCGFDLTGVTFHDGRDLSEKSVFLDNWDKWVKVVPGMTYVLDKPITDEEKGAWLDMFLGSDVDARLSYLYSRRGFAKCPVKIFGCNQDESVVPASLDIVYKPLINSGQIAEKRVFNSFKDYTGTGTSAHHYDTQDPALRTSITTRYGDALTDIPIVYIEMLRFWQRFEQEEL